MPARRLGHLAAVGALVLAACADRGSSAPATTSTVATVATTTDAMVITTTAPTALTTAAAATTVAATTTTPATTTTGASIDEPGSPWWVVNPDRPVPPGYAPADLVDLALPVCPGCAPGRLDAGAAEALAAMFAEAQAAGHDLVVNSSYRSFEDQRALWERYMATYGEETTRRLVAVPGTSEHQTGLAVDVGLAGLPADQQFGATPAAAWVADNAHRFGFVVRYPPDKAAITGYADEPWHLRHVGADLAAELYTSGLTMEERFGLVPTSTAA